MTRFIWDALQLLTPKRLVSSTARTNTTTHTHIRHGLRAQSRRHISRWGINISIIFIIIISKTASGQHQRKDAVYPSTERAARRQTRSATETTNTTRVRQSESHPEPSQESSSSRSLHPSLKADSPTTARVSLQPILCSSPAKSAACHGSGAICAPGAARVLHARPTKTTNHSTRAEARVLFARRKNIFPNSRT